MKCNNNVPYEEEAEVLFSVGRRFLNGNGLEQNIQKARELLTQAAAMGHYMAANLLETISAAQENKEDTKTEYEKMLAGEIFDATDDAILEMLNSTKDLCWEYNQIRPTLLKERNEKLHQILGECDQDTFINQPFYCDYGKHIRVGKRFFANFNLVILDEAFITIGDDCFVGPNVSLLTACHSTNPQERKTRQEWAKPIRIGNNCWIGASVTILPGVTIGNGVTIGAGSVVVKDIPDNSLAVGNPARVIKKI